MTKNLHLPSEEEIIQFLQEAGIPVNKRDLSRHFKVHGREMRQDFKFLLKDMVKSKKIKREKGRSFSAEASLPAVARVILESFDDDFMGYMCKLERQGSNPQKNIFIKEKDLKNPKTGDIYLVRLSPDGDESYRGHPLKKIDQNKGQMVGSIRLTKAGAFIKPTNRRIKKEFTVPVEQTKELHENDLVVFKAEENSLLADIIENLGSGSDPKNISLIALHEHGIRWMFPEKAVELAENAKLPPLKNRTDLRDVPLITIDGADARDFDDAVFAAKDDNPKNPDGWKIIVAIADVAYYVRHNDPLDKEAVKRGNSVYFPDRVVPMLPEALSNGLCSLNPNEDRGCMALEMIIDRNGYLKSKKIMRGLMKSHARLTYNQMEDFINGQTDETTQKITEHLDHLYGAYQTLRKARNKRGALNITSDEQQVIFDDDMHIKEIRVREQLTAHQVIEELMVLSNVAVAELLEAKKAPCIYRVHDTPSQERIGALISFLSGFGYKLADHGTVRPSQLNTILTKADGKAEHFAINQSVLRSQSQAIYSSDNIGHFGLGLERYAHFTSPIRRYADLIVHRSLIRAYNLGNDGLTDEETAQLEAIAQDISDTERAAVRAERDSMSRLTAFYLSQQEETVFDGQISGVADAGLFVRLPKIGAEGFVPMRRLPRDFYILDDKTQSLIGKYDGRIYQFLAPIRVKLLEVAPLSDNVLFEPEGDKSAILEGFQFKNLSSKRGKGQKKKFKSGKYNKHRGKKRPKSNKNKGKGRKKT